MYPNGWLAVWKLAQVAAWQNSPILRRPISLNVSGFLADSIPNGTLSALQFEIKCFGDDAPETSSQ